jgi:phenylacetate-CoA ligase
MSGLYTSFTSGVLFPLHEKLKRHSTVSVRRRLEETQWWSAEQLQALQVRRLQALLVEVGKHVPYYRDLFHALSFDPKSVNSMPPVRRRSHQGADTRSNRQLKHEQATGLARFTGGSSGRRFFHRQ